MKGIVFDLYHQLVCEKFGLKTWDALLNKVCPASGGAYTSGASYPDSELLALVSALGQQTKLGVDALIRSFGEFMFPRFARLYPEFFKPGYTLATFLKSVETIVHVEVLKLYPDAYVPKMHFEDDGPGRLMMTYQSRRKLCALAEGLLLGAARYYKTGLVYKQIQCMHQGASHCSYQLQILEENHV
ncbi:MAG: heme NO-binding domain-containing protein [Vampirovibrionales bacterium]|nr:heme NO-binding domain-containing protein [Vampirovibrionales bacterium]